MLPYAWLYSSTHTCTINLVMDGITGHPFVISSIRTITGTEHNCTTNQLQSINAKRQTTRLQHFKHATCFRPDVRRICPNPCNVLWSLTVIASSLPESTLVCDAQQQQQQRRRQRRQRRRRRRRQQQQLQSHWSRSISRQPKINSRQTAIQHTEHYGECLY